ncbi:MAG: hypothetical protein OXC11_12080, partial [Rhodospirillales bacterium]|nr:hypothetical protein [Rhodospirillales bacterium]
QFLNIHQERPERQPGAPSRESYEQIHIAALVGVIAHHRTKHAHLLESVSFGKGTDLSPS